MDNNSQIYMEIIWDKLYRVTPLWSLLVESFLQNFRIMALHRFLPMAMKFTDSQFPAVSPDGKYLFFTRWTPDYDEDVFYVSAKIIERL